MPDFFVPVLSPLVASGSSSAAAGSADAEVAAAPFAFCAASPVAFVADGASPAVVSHAALLEPDAVISIGFAAAAFQPLAAVPFLFVAFAAAVAVVAFASASAFAVVAASAAAFACVVVVAAVLLAFAVVVFVAVVAFAVDAAASAVELLCISCSHPVKLASPAVEQSPPVANKKNLLALRVRLQQAAADTGVWLQLLGTETRPVVGCLSTPLTP